MFASNLFEKLIFCDCKDSADSERYLELSQLWVCVFLCVRERQKQMLS